MGYQPIMLDAKLVKYLQFYVDYIWPLFFKDPPEEKFNQYLFIGTEGSSLTAAGTAFASTLEKYTGAYVSPSTLRKIVETQADSANIYQDQERRLLSKGLLHEYDTAKDYYVMNDKLDESKTILALYQKLRAKVSSISLY